jgi:hypothetical protein
MLPWLVKYSHRHNKIKLEPTGNDEQVTPREEPASGQLSPEEQASEDEGPTRIINVQGG